MMEKGKITGSTVTANFFWRFAERWGAQGVNFIVTIVLARLLAPSDYGIIAIVSAIIAILDVFVDSGLANALIQKKNADDLDFSTVFYFNMLFCFILYIGVFFISPLLGKLYKFSELPSVLRVLGLTLIISGVKNTQMSYVSKNMQFKKFFFSTLGGTIISAVIGIIMAYLGYGVWAIVFQHLFNSAIDTFILMITVRWHPSFCFSTKRLSELFSFGWKILISNLIGKVYNNIQTFVIGTRYTSLDLGLYNKGMSFPVLLVENINSAINSVLLPTLSSAQDDNIILKRMTRRSIKISTYILAPMIIGLFFIASPLIKTLLTDKWLGCVPYLRVFCIIYLLYPIQSINMNAIFAKGRSDIYLKIELLKKIIGIFFLIISMQIGVFAIACGLLIVNILSVMVNVYINKKILDYKVIEQINDFIPNILIAFFMGICVYLVEYMNIPSALTVLIQILVGIIVYILESILFKIESFEYVFSIIRAIIKKR